MDHNDIRHISRKAGTPPANPATAVAELASTDRLSMILESELLSDGSKVYNVRLSRGTDTIRFAATSKRAAVDLIDAMGDAIEALTTEAEPYYG